MVAAALKLTASGHPAALLPLWSTESWIVPPHASAGGAPKKHPSTDNLIGPSF